MTCIVAIEHPSGVLMGADSFIGNDDSAEVTAEPKIMMADGIGIGTCGAVLMTTWMAGIALPKRRRGTSPRDYVAGFAMALRDAAIDAKIATSDGSSPASDSLLLLAVGGQAWVVQPDFSVYRSAHGYTSIGSGSSYALGSLAGSRGAPKHRAAAALRAAVRHCPSVRAPLTFVEVAK